MAGAQPPANAPGVQQKQLESNCRPDSVLGVAVREIPASLRLRHPRVALDSVAPLLARREYRQAMDVALAFARAALASDPVPEREREAMARRLQALDSTFTVAVALPERDQARYVANDIRPAQFQLQTDGVGDFVLFPGEADSIRVSRSLSVDRQRALCWPAITVEPVLTMFGAPRRARTIEALDALAGRWDNYVRNSFSQLPWELALNGALRGRDGYEPPRQQFVLLHPSLGVEANGTVWKELRRVDVALIEPLGWIFYYNADYTRYLGVSSVVTFATNRNVAVGGYLHLWFPQAKVGYVRRSDPDPQRQGSVLVSIDLYDFLSGVPEELKASRSGALGGKLLEAIQGNKNAP